MNQQQAAMQSMKEWLSHPGELGKEPAKIEPAGEFDLHDLHYYIFRYKKGMFGKWLLGAVSYTHLDVYKRQRVPR